jgi:hypothetical protein
MRVLYSTVALLAPSKSLNPVSSAIGLKLGLSFIPELLAVIAFVVVGFVTRNVRRVRMDGRSRELETGVDMGRMERNNKGMVLNS